MINLNIKNDDEKLTAEYLLQQNDRIDNLTLGMMVHNKIKGVVPIQPVQVENDRYFRYDITGMITMKKYLGESVKRDKILKAFYDIAQAIKESTEYMINWTSFSLDKKDIYIDEETGDAKLICIPLLTVINDGNTCNFFKSILFSSQFDLDENGDYVGKLINFLNPKTYTLDKFIFELEELLELEHKVEEIVEEDEEELEEVTEETVEEVTEETTEEVTEETVEETKEETTEEVTEEETKETNDDIPKVIPKEDRPEIAPFLIKMSNGQKIPVDKDTFYVGKDEKNVDYCIAGNSAVDDRHAYIVKHNKEYFVVDNNSRNHTYMNRVLIPSEEEIFIPHGAQLRFADEDFEFKMHK